MPGLWRTLTMRTGSARAVCENTYTRHIKEYFFAVPISGLYMNIEHCLKTYKHDFSRTSFSLRLCKHETFFATDILNHAQWASISSLQVLLLRERVVYDLQQWLIIYLLRLETLLLTDWWKLWLSQNIPPPNFLYRLNNTKSDVLKKYVLIWNIRWVIPYCFASV